MSYFIHRCGITIKVWLRILNLFLIILIPFGAYQNKKFLEAFPNKNKESYWEVFKEEIKIWKQGFKFGE